MPSVVTDAVLDERRRLGIDASDERWEGEWHLVNPPKHWHALLQRDLLLALVPLARAHGLEAYHEPMGLFGADDDWRVPDLIVARPDACYGDAGMASAEIVVEVRSPGDDTYRKLGFYARRGVEEVWVPHRDRRVELFRPDGGGGMVPDAPAPDGSVRSEVLDVVLMPVAGPRLRLAWDGGEAEV